MNRACNNDSWKQFAWATFPEVHYVTCLCCGWRGRETTQPRSIVLASRHLEFCSHDQHGRSTTEQSGRVTQ
jgi:hypothetical protein